MNQIMINQPIDTQLSSVIAIQKCWRVDNPQAFSLAARQKRLKQLHQLLHRHNDQLCDAVANDLGRPAPETQLCELLAVKAEINYVLKRLRLWMRQYYVPPTLMMLFTWARVRYEPKGQVLILSPWNFPIALALRPMVSAIAAGNSVIIKPSEHCSQTSNLLAALLAEYFDPREVFCVTGGADVAQTLLQQPFDHVLFTGSTSVGQKVAQTCASQLIPLTLELGGKCPVLIQACANIKDAANKIAWASFINAGQTCLAPDYLLVPASIKAPFIHQLKQAICQQFGDSINPMDDFTSIINSQHHQRLDGLLRASRQFGDKIILEGVIDKKNKIIGPTLIECLSLESPLMQEEIFGPVLPILVYEDITAALNLIRSLPSPLCVYGFSANAKTMQRQLSSLSAGSIVINDVLTQYLHSGLPFGGIGQSGYGDSHGRYGFESFSLRRALFRRVRLFNPLRLIQPPYTSYKKILIRLVNKLC